MNYTNGTFTGTYNQCRDYLNASIPREHHENWPNPDDPTGEIKWTVVEVEPYQPTLEQRRERQRQILKQERIERTSAPINNVQVATPEDRENVQWAASNVESIDWIMADNTIQPLTAADLQSVASAYPLRKMQLFEIYANLLQQLNASDNPEEITWPE